MRRSRHDSGVLVLRPQGPSLDADSAAGLKDALREQIAAGEHELCVDLDEVESMDSTGLGVLIGAFRQLGGRGTIRLSGVRPMVRTLLHMTQMTRMFPIVDTLDPDSGSGSGSGPGPSG